MVERGLIMMNELKLFPNSHDLFLSAAEDFTRRANAAVETRGEFTVVLSGGDTPKYLFDTLTQVNAFKNNIPWKKIKFFFGDERYVPADNPKSNYHMAYEHLFSKVPVLTENIFRIPTEPSDPIDAAKDYEFTLRQIFHLNNNEFPHFDLLYLGLGEDAHTASLMPFNDVLLINNHQLVASVWLKEQAIYRISLTPLAINHAMNIIFIVTGENKASAVSHVLEGPREFQQYPAQRIQCMNNPTLWYLDKAAASKLNDH